MEENRKMEENRRTSLEGLIRRRLVEDERIVSKLAVYAESPAIFYQEAPGDTQAGWLRKTQYPRIVFNADMLADRERKSAGTLVVTLYCDTGGTEPEAIEPLVKDRLTGVLMKTDSGAVYCFAWNRTDAFDMPEAKGARVCGMDVRFDIVEYVEQYTTDPDPIMALCRYIKEALDEAFVLFMDEMDDYHVPTDKTPAIYCRFESVSRAADETLGGTVAWMDGRIAVHILCPSADKRIMWAIELADRLAVAQEIVMMDKAPMRVNRLQMNTMSDYQKDGQLSVGVHYGILIGMPVGPPMGGMNMNF